MTDRPCDWMTGLLPHQLNIRDSDGCVRSPITILVGLSFHTDILLSLYNISDFVWASKSEMPDLLMGWFGNVSIP